MREGASCFDFRGHVGEHPLNGLIVGNGTAEGAALLRVARGRFHRTLCQANRLRGNADATAVERAERNLQALPFSAENVFGGHATILENNFSGARESKAHLVFVAADAKARRGGLDEKRRDSASTDGWIGLGEDNVDVRESAVRHPALRAVQDVGIAIADGACLNSGGVGPGLRFGEAEPAENFAMREPRQVLPLMRVGAVLQNRRGRNGVGHAERDGSGGVDARDFLNHQRVGDRVRRRAAVFFRDEHAAAAEFAEAADFGFGDAPPVVLAENRTHLRFHELADGVADEELIAGEREIHAGAVYS